VQDSKTYFDPRTLARLKGLRLRARQIVEGFVAGLHRSPQRGFSIEFAEHREYAPGDDLRYVDWKVLGRTDKLYSKQFEDETNLVCHLVLDASAGMAYQGPDSPLSKLDYAKCAAAALAWLVLEQQDAVGIVTFDAKIRKVLAPARGSAHLRNVVRLLEATEPAGETAAGPVFHELAERFRTRGVVVLLSDLFDAPESVLAGLKHFHYRRHDVIAFHLLDRAEAEFPFDDPTRFRGLEQPIRIPVDARAIRRAYLDEFDRYVRELEAGCRQWSIDYERVETDRPLDEVLARYLTGRRHRLR